MPLWALLIALGVVKLIAAASMLWLALRSDSAMIATDDPPRSDSEDGGGGGEKAPTQPIGPHPRLPRPWMPPRRGPHGSPTPGSPSRVRTGSGRLPARERSWR